MEPEILYCVQMRVPNSGQWRSYSSVLVAESQVHESMRVGLKMNEGVEFRAVAMAVLGVIVKPAVRHGDFNPEYKILPTPAAVQTPVYDEEVE